MTLDAFASLTRRERLRIVAVAAVLVVAIVLAALQFVQPAPPRRIVLASGFDGGLYHRHARRYIEILARSGVTVVERTTAGAAENLALLLDPNSGVDVAFIQGGVAPSPPPDSVVMLATLYYEPLWVFYRGAETRSRINELRGGRLAVGAPGSGTRAFVLPLLAANGVTEDNSTLLPASGAEALRALADGTADAAFLVGGADTPAIQATMRDKSARLMSLSRADAYGRRLPYITKLTLPAGTIDFAQDVPATEVTMIGTKAMLAARDGLHPALVNLLIDAAHEIHSGQGDFEAAGEFPGTTPVDLRVSIDADEHRRFGPRFLYRYLPFWVATLIERAIIIVVPVLVVLIPLFNQLPQFVRWRIRSRIYRWYGELALLERDVRTRKGERPVEQWLKALDRIEHGVEGVKAPASFASEAYTLREHIALVRREILAAGGPAARPAA
jgi:TRAP transporter TAXI family solute receptor